MNDKTRRTAARWLTSLACGAAALTGGLLALACIVRLRYFPPSEMGGLALFWVCSLAIPLQLIPLLGALWSVLVWRARALTRVGCALLILWALLSLAAFALGLLGLLLHD